MKKIIFTAVLVFMFTISYSQNDFRFLPDSNMILKSLSFRPVLRVVPRHFNINYNVTTTIKKRLLHLLNDKWDSTEIRIYLDSTLKEYGDYQNIIIKAKKIANENDSLYKSTFDSLLKLEREDLLNNTSNLFYVDGGLIKVAAFLDLKKAVPILTNALLKKNSNYDSNTVKLALARFGNKTFQKSIINECNYINSLDGDAWFQYYTAVSSKLIYLNTQESVHTLVHWLDTTKRRCLSSKCTITKLLANRVIYSIHKVIMNKDFNNIITRYVNINDDPDDWGENALMVIECRNWMIKNKGKYKLNNNFYPY